MMAPDAHSRTIEALQSIARVYGVEGDLERLKAANAWQSNALAMLAEAVAAIIVELPQDGVSAQRTRAVVQRERRK